MGTNDDDFVEHLVSTSTHDTVLFFTNKGKVYRAKGYEVPEFSRTAKGIPIINLLQIERKNGLMQLFPFPNTAVIGTCSLQQDMGSLNGRTFPSLLISEKAG